MLLEAQVCHLIAWSENSKTKLEEANDKETSAFEIEESSILNSRCLTGCLTWMQENVSEARHQAASCNFK